MESWSWRIDLVATEHEREDGTIVVVFSPTDRRPVFPTTTEYLAGDWNVFETRHFHSLMENVLERFRVKFLLRS